MEDRNYSEDEKRDIDDDEEDNAQRSYVMEDGGEEEENEVVEGEENNDASTLPVKEEDEESSSMLQFLSESLRKEREERYKESSNNSSQRVLKEDNFPNWEDYDYDSDKYKKDVEEWNKRNIELKEREEEKKRAFESKKVEFEKKVQKMEEDSKKYGDNFKVSEQIVLGVLNQEKINLVIDKINNSAKLFYMIGRNPSLAKKLASINDNVDFVLEAKRILETEKEIKRVPTTKPQKSIKSSGGKDQRYDNTKEEYDPEMVERLQSSIDQSDLLREITRKRDEEYRRKFAG